MTIIFTVFPSIKLTMGMQIISSYSNALVFLDKNELSLVNKTHYIAKYFDFSTCSKSCPLTSIDIFSPIFTFELNHLKVV